MNKEQSEITGVNLDSVSISELVKRFEKFEEEQRSVLRQVDKRLSAVESGNPATIGDDTRSPGDIHVHGAEGENRDTGVPVMSFSRKEPSTKKTPVPQVPGLPHDEFQVGLSGYNLDALRLEFESIKDSLTHFRLPNDHRL